MPAAALSGTRPDLPKTMPETPPAAASTRRPRLWGLRVFLIAGLAFLSGLWAEPHFVDESAYIAQSFYADLFLEGHHDDPAWLDYAAFDLPPLSKYLVGTALRLGGHPRPGPADAWNWYRNTKTRVASDAALHTARLPSVLFGALGCVAIYAIGTRGFGRPAGLVAAGLLVVNPLYRMLTRRAMSDIPAESCMLVALAFGLAGWSRLLSGKGGGRGAIEIALGGGVFTGLAVLAKLNGTIAGMILAAWMVLGLVLRRGTLGSKLALVGATFAAGLVAFGLFAALNPFLTAHPTGPLSAPSQAMAKETFVERLGTVMEHRVGVSTNARDQFPNDALTTPRDKLAAVAVQGYGRFSPFGPGHSDSRIRFDWRQDWGAVVWIPLVLAGLVVSLLQGRAQYRAGEPPAAWAIALAWAVALVVVTGFIPLAWDRYYISLQPGAALLAAAALTAPFARLRPRPEAA
jgi:4-amino-4-deoxy-L-arabinose transferase-like glycosyltransferase